MTATATRSVWDALAEAISTGASPPDGADSLPLLADLRVHRDSTGPGKAALIAAAGALATGRPPGDDGTTGFGYFLLGQRFEDETDFYAERGQAGEYRIHCWSDTADNASRLYAWLKGLIHEVRLELDGHTMIHGSVRWITDQADPDGRTWQVMAGYTATSDEG